MEQTYLDANTREYELTKHFSLRLHFPIAFLQLQATGTCEIDIPEWMFDLDYPGHYMRRIKNVSLTIPAVTGPYHGVHCRLTLLDSTTRISPNLAAPPHACPDGRPGNGYPPLPDDPRIVRQYAATEAIATSSSDDDGLFELNFRDERLLPFEFAGAVSHWRIDLPAENNHFDIDTVTDVVLHVNYTAREGGDNLRRDANDIAQRHLPGAGLRYIDVQHDMPDAWHRFHAPAPGDDDKTRHLTLQLGRHMFPFLPGRQDLRFTRLELFIQAPGAEPNAHHRITFAQPPRHDQDHPDHKKSHEINCVARANWPGLYHGVLEHLHSRSLSHSDSEFGTLHIPTTLAADTSRVILFCRYEQSPPGGATGDIPG